MTYIKTKQAFKRAATTMAELCPFYKATFTTQISRIRFNRMLHARRARLRTGDNWALALLLCL